ncbi:MAG TPA: Fe-S cluster assembly protein SufD [Bacteroidia bacterium]|nr:Fe-S cluster assembly protein SufD [Bacteroidia bacterium]
MIAEKTATTQILLDSLSRSSAKVPFINNEILARALAYLENKGIPGKSHEEYKYCNMEAILRREFSNCKQKSIQQAETSAFRSPLYLTIVLLNGRYAPDLSDAIPSDVVDVKAFSALGPNELAHLAYIARVEQDAFIALNTAFTGDGAYIKVKSKKTPAKPIRVLNLLGHEGDYILNSRYVLHLEEGALAELVEEQRFTGTGKVFSNLLSERLLERNTKLRAVHLQIGFPDSYTVNSTQALLAPQSEYTCCTFSSGAQLIRNNHNVVLGGKESAAHLYGLFYGKNNQLIDNHTLMDHQVPDCQSNELYKGIGDDKSTAVFNGKIYVRKDAQKTNAYQSSKNILLSDEAGINAKPQLEIYANDVKCSHGTSTGRIDETALFYLRSRGISEQSARKLLLQAFAQEVIDSIESEAIRNLVGEQFMEHLHVV